MSKTPVNLMQNEKLEEIINHACYFKEKYDETFEKLVNEKVK